MTYRCEVVADSVSPTGTRLLSVIASYPSGYHAEILSNRDLSVTAAGGNVHRPMSEVRSIITATAAGWQDFFKKYAAAGHIPLALTGLAQHIAQKMRNSKPGEVGPGAWHLPFIDRDTVEDMCILAIEDFPTLGLTASQLDSAATMLCLKMSVIRCLNVGDLKPPQPRQRAYHDARMKFYNELFATYTLLAERTPLCSAFEHQATPDRYEGRKWALAPFHGNLKGWQQHRMLFIEPVASCLHNADWLNTQEKAHG